MQHYKNAASKTVSFFKYSQANKALKVFERGQRPEKMSEIPMYCTSCMDTIRSNGVDLEANMRKPTASSSVHEHSATNNLP